MQMQKSLLPFKSIWDSADRSFDEFNNILTVQRQLKFFEQNTFYKHTKIS